MSRRWAFTMSRRWALTMSRRYDRHVSSWTSQSIHPLSQIVLEHLQSSHSKWIQRMGLEQGLDVKQDGTFVLRFANREGETAESIW